MDNHHRQANAPAPLDVDAIRRDFPILQRLIYGKPLVYLDNAATSQKPRQVIQSLVDYYERYNSNIHRGVHALSMEATDAHESARARIAAFIGAPRPDQLIFTRNTTEALNLIAYSWGMRHLKAGDEIVLTEMEHHSNLVPWQGVAQATGAKLRFIPVTEQGVLDLSNLSTIINERTKLVSVVHMSNVLGAINPVEEIGRAARAAGATFVIDGAQSVPHMPVDVKALDCDFLAFSSHKMLGPTGIGGLYVKESVLAELEPFLKGGEMVKQVYYDRATWNDAPMRYEAGTPNIADAIAFGVAVDYLSALGMKNVHAWETELTQYALKAFDSLEEVTVYGPRDPKVRGGIVSFYYEKIHPHDLGTLLDRDGIAIRTGHHCAMPLVRKLGVPATARASFYLYNTKAEVDLLVDSLKRALHYFDRAPASSRTKG